MTATKGQIPPVGSAHLQLVDGLTSALLPSLQLQDRLQAALSFFVPSHADAASIAISDAEGKAFVVARGSQAGGSVLDISLEAEQGPVGVLRLEYAGDVPVLLQDLVGTLGRRLGQLLDEASRFEREQRAAFAFQYVALAAEPPQIPGYRIDRVYQAGRAEALVGGDWYDAFALPDGRLIVSIGDVVGSGLRAAVTMVNVRQSLRTVAQLNPDPMVMLEAANRTLIEEFPDRFVTTFVAVIDPVTEHCVYSGAGHPPPLLRLPSGDVVPLAVSGVPLGVPDFSKHLRVDYTTLSTGSVLLLYTDGLTEATHDVLQGERLLREALSTVDPGRAPAKDVYARVLGAHPRDDVAILSVFVEGKAALPRWRFDPRWPDVAHRARAEMRAELRLQGYGDSLIVRFDLVFAELVANVIRHAPGTVEFLLQLNAHSLVLHVFDKGPGFRFAPRLPNDLFAETGRGVFLISTVADEFAVEARPGGGSHARAVFFK